MRYQDFGGLKISQLGLGCASAWGQKWFDEGKAAEIVHRAMDAGITVYDTGSSYSNGNAEPRLGRVLRRLDKDSLLISTKIGTHISPTGKLYKDWSREAIVAQITKSRLQLQLDTIPLVYLHGPVLSDFTVALFDTLEFLKSKGWVRNIGVNSFDDRVLEKVVSLKQIDVVMPDYNLTRIDREPVILKLHQAGKLVIGGAALANQIHAPHFSIPKSRVQFWYLLRALRHHRSKLFNSGRLAFLKSIPGWTPAQIAIAFSGLNSCIASAVFGTTSTQHLEENIRAIYRELPADVLHAIYSA